MWNEDDRKWLYDTMSRNGVDTGSYDEFAKSLDNKEDRDWYYNKSLSLGLNVGSAEEFEGMMIRPKDTQVPPAPTAEDITPTTNGGENGYTFTADELGFEEAPAQNAVNASRSGELAPELKSESGVLDGPRVYKKVSDQPVTLRPSVAANMSPEQIAQAEAELARLNGAPKAEEPEKEELHIDGWTGAAPKIKPQAVLLPEDEFKKLTREQKLDYLNSLEENKKSPYPSDASEEDLDTAYMLHSFRPNRASTPESKRMQALLEDYRAELNRPGTEDRRREIGLSPQLIYLQDREKSISRQLKYGEITPEQAESERRKLYSQYAASRRGGGGEEKSFWEELKDLPNELVKAVTDPAYIVLGGVGTGVELLTGYEGIREAAERGLEKNRKSENLIQDSWDELTKEAEQFGSDVAQSFEEVGAGVVNLVGYTGGLLGADSFQESVTKMTDRWLANNNPDKGFIASLIPSVSGALLTIGAGIVGGPGAATAVGNAWFGTQVASSAGNTMREAEKYGATEGQMWATGLLNGGAEYFTEKIPLKRLLSKVPGKFGSAVGKVDDVTLDAEVKKLREVIQGAKGVNWKEIGATALEEGGTEAVAGIAQTAIEMIYKNPEDYPGLKRYLDAAGESALGGALVGSVTGRTQDAAQRRADNKRRKAAGKVIFAMGKDEKGNPVAGELIGKDEKGNTIMEVSGKYITVTEVGKGITMTYEQFKKAELDDMLAGTYSEGYSQNPELINGNTIALAGKAVNDAKAGVRAALNLSDDADVDAMIADKEFEGDAKEAVDTYLAEKARYEGMQDRLNEEKEDEIAEADKSVDVVMHEDGNVYMTTLPSTGEAIFITGGKVVLDEEGYIDVNQSESLVALMPNGKKEAVQPGNVREKVSVENAEAQKAAKRAEIDARYNNQLNTFVYSDGMGDHTVQLIGRRGNLVDVIVDGRQMEMGAQEYDNIMAEVTGNVVPGAEISQAENAKVEGENGVVPSQSTVPTAEEVADAQAFMNACYANSVEAYQEYLDKFPEGAYRDGALNGVSILEGTSNVIYMAPITNAENVLQRAAAKEVQPVVAPVVEGQKGENAVESSPTGEVAAPIVEAPKTALERVPKAENGEPIYEQADAETAWDAIMEQANDEELATQVVEGMIADKEAALKKLENSKVREGVTVAEKIAAAQQRKATIEQAKADLAKWEEIAGVKAKRAAAQAENVAVPVVEETQTPVVESAPVEDNTPQSQSESSPTLVEQPTPQATNEMQEAELAPAAEPVGNSEQLSSPEIPNNQSVAEGEKVVPAYRQAIADAGIIETDMSPNGKIANTSRPATESDPNAESEKLTHVQAEIVRKKVRRVFERGGSRQELHDAVYSAAHHTNANVTVLSYLYKILDAVKAGKVSVEHAMDFLEEHMYVDDNVHKEWVEKKNSSGESVNDTTLSQTSDQVSEQVAEGGNAPGQSGVEEIQEPRSVEETLENGDKRITNYNSRGEVATVATERDGKVVSVDSYNDGVLFEHTEYDGNGKAASVTRYDKSGNAIGTQKYVDGKAKASHPVADEVFETAKKKQQARFADHAKAIAEKLGVVVTVHNDASTVTNGDVMKAITDGNVVKGWYNPNTGEIALYMPNMKSKRDVESIILHEAVSHYGIKHLLKEDWTKFLDGVWDMMPTALRAHYLQYVGADMKSPTQKQMRQAADEYVAHIAEKMDLDKVEKSIWNKLIDAVFNALRKVGFKNLTRGDIETVIRASYANLRQNSLPSVDKSTAPLGQRSSKVSQVTGPGETMASKKMSERRQEKNRINNVLDEVGGIIYGNKEYAKKQRLKREAERKELAKEIYSSVLKGDFNDVTLSQIDKFIEDATPANPFGRRISQRLPQRMERALRQGARTNAVDALFSRISESAVPANERFSEAGRRKIEERKKELLKGWAIATGNWHTDLKEFTDDTEPIGEGKDSKVYSSKDGRYVIKASKGKPFGKRFRPDIDNIALFNDVFRDTRYEILGYGEIDGEFVRILQQPIVDFAESTPLTSEERREYMQSLGFEPLNDANTAFADGEIVIADLQKGNVVRDAAGNISVIDADAKLHTKDVGGDYTYPPVETDLPEGTDLGGTMFSKVTPEMDAEYMSAVENGDMESVERLVKEAAKLAMPDTKVVDEDGYPMVVYHGSEEDFNVFDKTKGRANMDIQGMFFSPWDDDARGYGSNVRAFYLNITKPANESTGYKALNKFQGQNGAGIKAREYLVSAGYDGVNNEDQEFVAFDPNQIKSADAVTYDDNGNIIPLSERFNEEKEDIRFRRANKNQEVFVSNAQRAVEGIKQEKATPQQWLAMIKKNGGLKAAEEAWLGLEEWLNEKQGAVTKQEILDFIGANKIQIEEVNYANASEMEDFRIPLEKSHGKEFADKFFKAFDIEYGEFGIFDEQEAVDLYNEANGADIQLDEEGYWDDFDDREDILNWASRVMQDARGDAREIYHTRLDYTTDGLNNKREIALTVPTVESYNIGDFTHFGDAGNGRAVAWVRFGETTDSEGNRVLVIDEIQSKRHQDGREKGYKSSEAQKLQQERDALYDKMYTSGLSVEEHNRFKELGELLADVSSDGVPSAPFEKNWHELAMKRMLRLAAEEGFDKVAWTTGEQQAERYNLGKAFNDIEREDNPNIDGRRFVLNGANVEIFQVDENGNIVDSTLAEAKGKPLADVVGKDMAVKMMSLENGDMLEGEDLRIGGEGMKGFYDRMLPSFVQKYTKKWGAKVGEVTMPNLRENNTMHSVDVTPEMKESVMEGQTMFSKKITYDEAVQIGNDFANTHKGVTKKMVFSKGAAEVEQQMRDAGFTELSIEAVLDDYKSGDLPNASYLRSSDGIVFYKYSTDKDLNASLWHENGHRAMRMIYGDDLSEVERVFNALPEDIRNEKIEELEERGYTKEEFPKETVCYFIQDAYTIGALDNAKVDLTDFGKAYPDMKDFANFVQQIINYTRHGERNEDFISKVEGEFPQGKINTRLQEWDTERREEGTGVDEATTGTTEATGGLTEEVNSQEGETLFSKKELTPEQKKKQEALKENAKAIRKLHNVTSRFPITALRYLGGALETQEQREAHDRLFAERDAITGESMPAGLQTNPQAMTLLERITESLLKQAEQEKENIEMRLSAIRAYGRDLANVIKLMNAQKVYDRNTVRMFTDLVKMYLRNNAMDGLSSYEIARLLNLMQRATGGKKKVVYGSAVKIAEIITGAHTKQLNGIMEKQIKTGKERVNASGVVVQGGVDIIGKRVLNTYRDAIEVATEEDFKKRYDAAFARVGDLQKSIENAKNAGKDTKALENLLKEAQADADAMLLAANYRNEIKAVDADIKALKRELSGKYDALVKGEITRGEYYESAKSINSQIVQMRAKEIDAYQRVLHALSGDIYEGVQRARAFREAEAMRVQRIHDMAENDMGGVTKSAERKEPGVAGKTVDMMVYKNPLTRAVMHGLGTYENYMKYFGRDHLDGRGELFEYFMTAFNQAQDKEWKESQNDFNILEAAARKIFGKKKIGKTYKTIARDSTKGSGVILKYWDGGATVERELTIGQLMYLYMTEKQAEGQMKLRNMGLTEEKVQNAVEKLPAKYKAFADYIQTSFLPEMRPRMNEVHQRMFGASMSEVENYFPLKVNQDARKGDTDLNNTGDAIPSTITGAVIKRRVNVTPIDLTANAFDVLNEHIVDMEHWAAFAEFTRDNNTLINDNDFKNRVKNTKSVRHGDGETLWKDFVETAKITTGNYQQRRDYIAKLMSGANAAKITFGYYTALKQLSSLPAFLADANAIDLVWNTAKAYGSWQWAIKNLPGFEERWKGRTGGNERLGENEYSIHDSRIMKAARMAGMTPNAFIDAVVVAAGARAVYETRLRFYKSLGLTNYEADKRAKNDAAISYNETQQSGQGAYLSRLQKEGGIAALLTTLFRNSQMAFQRRVVGSMVNTGKKLARGERIREATKRKYMQMGMDEATAEKRATMEFYKSYAKDITNLAIFGYGMNYLWVLMGQLPYLLFGDDDEEKEKIYDQAKKVGVTGMFEGFTLGNVAKAYYENKVNGTDYAVSLLEAPFEQDLDMVLGRFEKDGTMAGILQLGIFLTEMNTGISPQRLIDDLAAVIDLCDGDVELANDGVLFALRLLKAPQSQQDMLILDELEGADAERVKKVAEKFIEYKMTRNFPFGSEDEKRVDKYANKFVETLKERVVKDYDPEDISVIYDQSSDTEKEILKKKWVEEMDKRNGTNAAKSLRKEKIEELLGSPVEKATQKALHRFTKTNPYEKMETFDDLERWYEYDVLHDKFKSDYEKIRDGEELSPEERAKAVEHYGVYADKGFKEVINAIKAHKKLIKENNDPEWRMSEIRRLTDIATEIMKRYE